MAGDTDRTDRPNLQQIKRNVRLTEENTVASPFNEEIMAGDADYGEALYDNMPADNVGFIPGSRKRGR